MTKFKNTLLLKIHPFATDKNLLNLRHTDYCFFNFQLFSPSKCQSKDPLSLLFKSKSLETLTFTNLVYTTSKSQSFMNLAQREYMRARTLCQKDRQLAHY